MLYAFPVLATVIYKQHRNPQLAGYLPSFYAAPELNIHSLWLQGGEGKGKKATPRWSPRWKLSLKEPQISTRETPSNGEKLKTTPENRKSLETPVTCEARDFSSFHMFPPSPPSLPSLPSRQSRSSESARICLQSLRSIAVHRQRVNKSMLQWFRKFMEVQEFGKFENHREKIADSDSACCTSASLHISNSKIFQIHGLIYQILSHEFEIRTEFCVLSIDHRHLPTWI